MIPEKWVFENGHEVRIPTAKEMYGKMYCLTLKDQHIKSLLFFVNNAVIFNDNGGIKEFRINTRFSTKEPLYPTLSETDWIREMDFLLKIGKQKNWDFDNPSENCIIA